MADAPLTFGGAKLHSFEGRLHQLLPVVSSSSSFKNRHEHSTRSTWNFKYQPRKAQMLRKEQGLCLGRAVGAWKEPEPHRFLISKPFP